MKVEKTVIEPSERIEVFNFRELWEYRELLCFLTWRNLKVRYSQTVIGVLWVVMQPVLTMLVFSVLFGRFAKLPSEGAPYTIFVFVALLPWNLLATATSGAGVSLVVSRNLISKVYFPRIIVPIAKVMESVIDFCISCVVLFCLMLFYRIFPGINVLFLPFFILWTLVLALGVGIWLSALNVKYRDVNYAIPFLVQIWLYASPVAYTLNLVPKKWHWMYSLNPMVGIIEGFRWSLLGKGVGLVTVFPISLAVTFAIFITAITYFSNSEKTFADII